MSGKLLQQARKDASRFAKSGGFEEDITLKTKDGSISLVVKGLTSGHTQILENDGNGIISSSFHITISEQDLIDNEYPYRSLKSGKVDLRDHKVTFKDSTGVERNFVINENHPNATTGLIPCILGRAN